LELSGYKPYRVMNITDVGHLVGDGDDGEDKMLVGAKRENKTAWQVAEYYTDRFLQASDALRMRRPDQLVKATDTIQEQIDLITDLEQRGFTYKTTDGIYFDSTKDPHYGTLARLDLAGLQAGSRVALGEKRSTSDFALWKFSPDDGTVRDMQWNSPWGIGFPGWHIECSAIIRTTLGDQIDIHCGGVDHIPVHHTNEIAQTENVTGKQLAQFWMHADFLLIDGGKMSKSLQNVYVLDDLQAKGVTPQAFRYFCLSAQYRSKLNFTWEAVTGAHNALLRLVRMVQALPEALAITDNPIRNQFLHFLQDDLNTAAALGLVWDTLQNPQIEPAMKYDLLQTAEQVFALGLFDRAEELVIPTQVQALVEQRYQARVDKDWSASDQIRDQVAALGYLVSDTATGQEISKL
jgi:cysteinyl-tRNA synthetase